MSQQLGKYELFQEIGSGGFATVYRARDPDLDREVALKILDPVLMRDADLVERFRREARSAANLRHPNIVRIHDICQPEGRLAIVMELLPGPSLKDVIDHEAPLSPERAVEMLRPLAAALDYAHTRGLVHRDVKPSNAITGPEGTLVLTDFGVVKAAEDSGSQALSLTLSRTGMTLGTPAYMAPEQADAKAQAPVDYRADLYSLGVVAYEMLTGQVPFQGETPLAVAIGHLMEEPPSPRELNPALPEGVEAALLTMLAKKPEERFGNAEAFVGALAEAAAPQPRPAGPVAPQEPAASAPAPAPMRFERPKAAAPPAAKLPTPALPPASARQRRGVPGWVWGLVGLVALLLLLGLGAVWLALGGGATPEPAIVHETVVVTQEAGSAPQPTNTVMRPPTDTPQPTNTPEIQAATPTPVPPTTDTPAPPTDIPVPPTSTSKATAKPKPESTKAPTGSLNPSVLSGKIAFTVWNTRSMRYDLYVSRVDGTGRILLGEGFRQPQFSHDGNLLAVNGDGALNFENLVVMDPTGSGRAEVSNNATDSFPTWSPDGAIVAYSSDSWGDGITRLGIVHDMFGKQQEWIRVDTIETQGDYPVWLVDGRIVYSGCDFLQGNEGCGLYWVGAGGGNYHRLTTHESDTAPAGDQGQVAFMSRRNGNWEVYVVNMDSGGLNRLTNNSAQDGLPAWSPDRKSIAFVSNRGDVWAIWVMNTDGSNQRKLFDLGGGYGTGKFSWTRERISWAP